MIDQENELAQMQLESEISLLFNELKFLLDASDQPAVVPVVQLVNQASEAWHKAIS